MMRQAAAMLGSLVLAAGGALAVITATASNTSHEVTKEAPRSVVAPPAPLAIACGGGLVRSVGVAQDVQQVNEEITAGAWVVSRSENPMSVFLEDSPILTDSQNFGYYASASPLSGVLSTNSVTSGSAELAAASVHGAQAGDLQGIAVNACGRASMDQWLVGSSGKIGTSSSVLVTNPGKTPVVVNFEALSEVGRIPLGGSSTAVLGAGETKRVTLDAALAESERIAVHVTTNSGGVYASMQTSSLDGYTPAGVSFVAPSHEGNEQIIPGVTIIKESGGVLRLANPHTETATVRISTLSADGERTLPGGESVEISGESVLDLSLDGLDAGITSLRVTSDISVLASAKSVARADTGGADISWAVARSSDTVGGAVFGAFAAQAAFTSQESARVTLTPISATGEKMDDILVDVAASGQSVVDLPQGAVAAFYSSDKAVTGSVTVRNSTGIEWLALTSSAVEQRSTRIIVK